MKPIILIATHKKALSLELKAAADMYAQDTEWVLPDSEKASQASVAACWYPDADLLDKYKNLKLLHSIGAGADNIGELAKSGLPVHRIIDDGQKYGMFEYILWGILYFQRDIHTYQQYRKTQHWQRLTQKAAKDTKVSILGLGEIGAYVAKKLSSMGYITQGWSRSPKQLDNVKSYAGVDGLDSLLSETDFLVNLLPLSKETENILDLELMNKLPTGAVLINCGRGQHLVEKDLVTKLQNKTLAGAVLDVFQKEPLPADSPLWRMENLIMTPHIASTASNEVIIKQISEKALAI